MIYIIYIYNLLLEKSRLNLVVPQRFVDVTYAFFLATSRS